MASTSYAATEEMTNINRASRLLMGPCTDQLRDILRFHIHPTSFPAVINANKSQLLHRLTMPQRNLIFPNSGVYSGKYDDMDISLLYILLRNICGIQAHNRGWGNAPDFTDRSVSANIERLRLARNLCGHSTGTMSNAVLNQVWSEIRAAVMDLDLTLGQGNGYKYERLVDSIRFDTMDPLMEKTYRDQLLKQTEEYERALKSLKISQEETNRMLRENCHIPPHIKEQHKRKFESWKKDDKPFYEAHSFQNMLKKFWSRTVTTITGGPGSGKTATARHLALLLQTETEFEIVPVDDIPEITLYGNPNCLQLFILDDVIGVWGFELDKFAKLEKYSESISVALSKDSKILFTCRKAVFNEAERLFSFDQEMFERNTNLEFSPFEKKFLVDLGDANNRLNDHDRLQMLKNHCSQNALSFKPNEIPNVTSEVGMMMFPLLCKMFCSESKYRASGMDFFEKPYDCILKQMDYLYMYKRIQYASLVLCMFCQNELGEPEYMRMKDTVLEKCSVDKLSGLNESIKESLDNMVNTFTVRTSQGYSLIHDSVYEVLAYHYGKKHQEDVLKYMSSSFVAKKFSIDAISRNPGDLHIEIHEEHYPAFAKRLVRDLKCMELGGVFMNKILKIQSVCCAFIDELKNMMTYSEMKNLFFHQQTDILKLIFIDYEELGKVDSRQPYERDRQRLLMGKNLEEPDIRVISWVISYGHNQLLQFLFAYVTEHKESVRRVMGFEIPGESGVGYVSNLDQQTWFLTLSCYSGDEETVKLLLKHCDNESIDGFLESDIVPLMAAPSVDGNPNVFELICGGGRSPIHAASEAGHANIVDLLIRYGADCNKPGVEGNTPLCAAAQAGRVDVVKCLVEFGADYNKSNSDGNTPLHVASKAGHRNVVDILIEAGADCNKCDHDGLTPLHSASSSRHGDVVRSLIEGGADCNKSDNVGRTPLYIASTGHDCNVVNVLIQFGADCNKSDEKGRTPLKEASDVGNAKVVDLLIQHEADCNKSDTNGRTPLHEAANAGHGYLFVAPKSEYESIVRALIRSGANINQADLSGDCPLSVALQHNQQFIADILLEHGAKLNLPSRHTTLYQR